jgi:DNA-binding transcriptional LysR family regulator
MKSMPVGHGFDTDALRWFQQVADGATVTEVSEMNRISQPGVSRSLARLESQVGTPLLVRSGRKLRMTRAGAMFKRYVDTMLHELDDGLNAVNEVTAPDRGTVALAFQLSLATWLVPEMVASFLTEHPGVRFDLRPLRDELVAPMFSEGRIDLAITSARPDDPQTGWAALLIEPLRLAVSAQHRLATADAVSLADVATEPFIALRPTYLLRGLTERLCRQAGFTPRVAFEGDDLPMVQGFVTAGLGVALVPDANSAVHGLANPAMRYLPVTDTGAVREIGVAWSIEPKLLPAVELFRQHIMAQAGRTYPPRT